MYKVLSPGEQAPVTAKKHIDAARKELRSAARKSAFVDRGKLTSEEARDRDSAMNRIAFLRDAMNKRNIPSLNGPARMPKLRGAQNKD